MFGKQFDDVFHHLAAFFDMSHLPSAEQDGYLHFVVVLEKANRLLHLKLDIVLARLGSNANLLKLGLVLLTFGCPLTFVVLELSKVHNSANRRFGFGRDFDEIKPVFARFIKCFSCWNDA